jgi:sRNA-binding carbon storage regulator CsrA
MLVLTQRPDEEIVIIPKTFTEKEEITCAEIIIRKTDKNKQYTRIAIQAPENYEIFRRKIKK